MAVKLIKRDKMGSEGGQLNLNGPPKDPAKMSKVSVRARDRAALSLF